MGRTRIFSFGSFATSLLGTSITEIALPLSRRGLSALRNRWLAGRDKCVRESVDDRRDLGTAHTRPSAYRRRHSCRLTQLLRKALPTRIADRTRAIVHGNWRTYLFLNIATYGVLTASLVLTALVPRMHQGALGRAAFLDLPGLSAVPEAYVSGNVPLAAFLTFLANALFAALLTTGLPSLIIPSFGAAATVLRAGLVGTWMAPSEMKEWLSLIPHAPVVIIEIHAYILAALGSVVLWRKTFSPRRYGLSSAREGYRAGLIDNASLYGTIAVVLFFIAWFEAFEVIHLVPLFH